LTSATGHAVTNDGRLRAKDLFLDNRPQRVLDDELGQRDDVLARDQGDRWRLVIGRNDRVARRFELKGRDRHECSAMGEGSGMGAVSRTGGEDNELKLRECYFRDVSCDNFMKLGDAVENHLIELALCATTPPLVGGGVVICRLSRRQSNMRPAGTMPAAWAAPPFDARSRRMT
jgi:hypothetical protein